MQVLILGGDGYLGWPTAMHLSALGHDVVIVDNYMRRQLCREHNVKPLFPVPNLHERVQRWEKKSGIRIPIIIGDLAQWHFITSVFRKYPPDCIVHYAEQPSAPYSMLNHRTASLTLQNNLMVTLNVIQAVHKYAPDAHIVKLGTMGEYGTPNIDIEEGWIAIEHKGRKERFLYPRQAGSLYHTTKIMDTDLLWFYVRMWGLRVTDLMQGPVYGLITSENEEDEYLYSFFNYDEIFGTVLNRFVVQAVAGLPLTVYGQGGQTRGYLNIKDTLQCVRLSVEKPAARGELRIFNQFVETFSVKQLAEKVSQTGNQLGLNVKIRHIENPRKEAEQHYYNPANTGLLDIGLKPHYLDGDILSQLLEVVTQYKDNINPGAIFIGVKWV